MWDVLKVTQSLYRLERKLKLLVIAGLRSYSSWPGSGADEDRGRRTRGGGLRPC